MGEWTTPDDVRAQVQKAWDRGRILGARLTGEPLFPLNIRTRRPSRRALSEQFDDVRSWIRLLDEGCRARAGAGYEIVWKEIEHRQLGRNRVPHAIVVPSAEDALHLIGTRRASARFDALAALTLESFPTLREWLVRRPLVALEHAAEWPQIVAVLRALHDRPRPNVYLRQLDVSGVDTKFVEARRPLFTELLDRVLPADAIDRAARSFEARYGLRAKPTSVRFRILDPTQAIGGLTDLAVPTAQLAAHAPPGRRVFITENELNGLTFPELRDAIVIFGLGYGLEVLAELPWLHTRQLHYWGDIDTHGLVMLDRLRATFPHAQSLLMDQETLLAHQPLWVSEASPHAGPCSRLTAPEGELFSDLIQNRFGEQVRLEQERVSYASLQCALARLA